MAERVDLSEVEAKRSGTPPKYPWPTWMDGSWWRLKQGEDYTVSTHSFRVTAQQYAKRHGHRARTRLTDDGLVIQFVPHVE